MKTLIKNLKFVALTAMAFCVFGAEAGEKIAKVVFLRGASNRLKFVYDDKDYGVEDKDWWQIEKYMPVPENERMPWFADGKQSRNTDVIIDPSFAEYRPTCCDKWFCGNLTTKQISDIRYLNTSEVRSMSAMFCENAKLVTLDLTHFDMSKVTNTYAMIAGNYNLKTIYATSSFDTSKVVNSDCMFTNSEFIVGGAGTTYDKAHVEKDRAHIDGLGGEPGYFTELLPSVTVGMDPTDVRHATWKVYTNGVEVAGTNSIFRNADAKVVYTLENGFAYLDGTTVETNVLDTAVDPAVNAEEPETPAMTPEEAQKRLAQAYVSGIADIAAVPYRSQEEKDAATNELLSVYTSASVELAAVTVPMMIEGAQIMQCAKVRAVVYALADSNRSEIRPVDAVVGYERHTNYLHKVSFSDYSPYVVEDLLSLVRNERNNEINARLNLPPFGCSAYANTKSKLVGRNFDWAFGITDEYLVRVPSNAQHYASIGVSAPGALKLLVEEELLSQEAYDETIPYATVDGINQFGLHICDLVVPGKDKGFTTGTKPGAAESVSQIAFVRYALDRATCVQDVIDLANSVNIYGSLGIELHFLVVDAAGTSRVIEFVNNQVVVIEARHEEDQEDEGQLVTNFYLDYLKDPSLTIGSRDPRRDTPTGIGYGRYDFIYDHVRYEFGDAKGFLIDKNDMMDLLKKCYYSLTYTDFEQHRYPTDSSRWSELNGQTNHSYRADTTTRLPFFYCKDERDSDGKPSTKLTEQANDRWVEFDILSNEFVKAWGEYQSTGLIPESNKVWVTSHAAVYDLANQSFTMHFLEEGAVYGSSLSELIVTEPTPVENATIEVYSDGALMPVAGSGKWSVWSNELAYVVYTAKEGFLFADGTTVKTNELDTTANPAVIVGDLPVAPLQPLDYVAPVYVDNIASNGIAYWTTNKVYNYTVVTSAASQVAWGAAGVTNWFAVANNVEIDGVVCKGYVNLILCEGARLTVTNAASTHAGIETDENGSFAVYGQPDGAGELEAKGANTKSGCGAGIGGGKNGAGRNITINGGTITANGGILSSGIGGGQSGNGSNITINGGKVKCISGNKAAGIGGGNQGDGFDITINGGQVVVIGAAFGSGIGSGYAGRAYNVVINDGWVEAYGSLGGAAIGTGAESTENGSCRNIAINGGKVMVASAVNIIQGDVMNTVLIGGGYHGSPASNVVISSAANVLFNVTGFGRASDNVSEPILPMPDDFEGFVIQTSGTQEWSRVLVEGLGESDAAAIRALPFVITNAMTGETGSLDVNGGEIAFANVFCRLTNDVDRLAFEVRWPKFAISQQPDMTNGYEVVASTDANRGITDYAWIKRVSSVTDFHTLTNLMATGEEVFYGTADGTDLKSVNFNVDAEQAVVVVWMGSLPPGGEFRFTCSSTLKDVGTLMVGDTGTLVQDGENCVYVPKLVMGNWLALCFMNADIVTEQFVLKNLRYIVNTDETVAHGAKMTALPADKGVVGQKYLCQITYGHEDIIYTGDSGEFTYVVPPSVEVTPTEIDNTAFKVFRGGNPVEKTGGKYIVPSNSTVSVVYVVSDDDYRFKDGTTWKSAQFKADGTPGTPESVLPDAPVRYWTASKEIDFDLREHKVILAPEEMLPIAYSTNNWQDDKASSFVVVNVTNANTGAGVEIVATNVNGYADWMPLAGAYGLYNFLAIGEGEVTNLFGYVYYTANVELITNGLDVAGASFKVYVGEDEVLPNEDGKYIVETNSQVVVKYETTEDGIFFDDGTKKWQSAPLPADLAINNLAEIGGKVPAGHEPKAPSIWLGLVAQRYPWNGIVDVNYQIRNWPESGFTAKLEVKVGDTCVTNGIDSAGMTGIASGIEPVDLNAIAGEQKAKAKFKVFVQQPEE